MVGVHFDFQILIPVGLILIGGSIIYWLQYLKNEELDYYMWVGPWLFGAVVAGGYVGWLISGANATIWARIAFTVGGCVLGLILGVVGLITDIEMKQGPVDQYATTLVLLGIPVGVVFGMHIDKIWIVPGPLLGGFCLGPLVFILLTTLFISLPLKAAAWTKNRFRQTG
jgi:hypothetical protein